MSLDGTFRAAACLGAHLTQPDLAVLLIRVLIGEDGVECSSGGTLLFLVVYY